MILAAAFGWVTFLAFQTQVVLGRRETYQELDELMRLVGTFLAAFPIENKDEWRAIGNGLETTFGSRKLDPETLIEAYKKRSWWLLPPIL